MLFKQFVHPTMFWCAGSWNLTFAQNCKLRGVQRDMIRKMLGTRPSESDTIEDYMKRAEKATTKAIETHNLLAWDAVVHRTVFNWGGHVARMKAYDEHRVTYQTLIFKDWDYIKQLAEKNQGSQCHGRILRTWRWERPFYKYFGKDSWKAFAQTSKDLWMSNLYDMVTWRVKPR